MRQVSWRRDHPRTRFKLSQRSRTRQVSLLRNHARQTRFSRRQSCLAGTASQPHLLPRLRWGTCSPRVTNRRETKIRNSAPTKSRGPRLVLLKLRGMAHARELVQRCTAHRTLRVARSKITLSEWKRFITPQASCSRKLTTIRVSDLSWLH